MSLALQPNVNKLCTRLGCNPLEPRKTHVRELSLDSLRKNILLTINCFKKWQYLYPKIANKLVLICTEQTPGTGRELVLLDVAKGT